MKDPGKQIAVKESLAQLAPEMAVEQHCKYSFRFSSEGQKVSVKQYTSGKLLVQGKQGPLYWSILGIITREGGVFETPSSKLSSNLASETFAGPYIGIDEAGKGDYFGPLVIAAVGVNDESKRQLIAAGVKDSKRLTDEKCRELADTIVRLLPQGHIIVEISPERYNALYEQMKAEGKNLNTLLAWGHARALETLLQRFPCETAISDRFGREGYLRSKLMEKGRAVNLIQETKAERYVGVAAASVLARDRFLVRLKDLSESAGLDLPKGASNLVIEAGRKLVKHGGKEALVKVAKVHFKTTKDVLANL